MIDLESAEEPTDEDDGADEDDSTVAAVDLGSNSFHMVIARAIRGNLHIQDRLKEHVRLAGGLQADGTLRQDAQGRALACLERFGQRLRGLAKGRVRAVGTNTFRKAQATGGFLAAARRALGHQIEIIPGREEARLVYLGVAHSVADAPGRRLVIDIGGGSTECIVGERFEPLETDSLHMGCVSYSLKHFPGGAITRDRMRSATIAARLELQPLRRQYRDRGWERAVGSSGTIRAVERILGATGWSPQGITASGLRRLRKALLAAGHTDALALPGLSGDRVPVLMGGLAILTAVFDTFGLERMDVSAGALREGVLYDLLGRIRHEDVRDRTIRHLSERYHLDARQAVRVERCAIRLLKQAGPSWGLAKDRSRQVLQWASRLHEVGLAVSHAGYHKHGAYLVKHSDLPGFSREDRNLVAALIRGHRRKIPDRIFDDLRPFQVELAEGLLAVFRLAVVLCRSRHSRNVPDCKLKPYAKGVRLKLPPGWLEAHPLTATDLEHEAAHLEALGVRLTVV